ncbi:MAG: BrnT family toxin [Burkholderiaceae bacterium]|nr:BrnT family toxin [Burkholderiaceae bacterium]
MSILIQFDPVKNERNIAERGLPFDLVVEFDFDTAMIAQDMRKPYPEPRFQALGRFDGRLRMRWCIRP